METIINPDTLRERVRERSDESDNDSHCPNCHAMLTEVDRDEGECTNCGTSIDVNDESVDEDLCEE